MARPGKQTYCAQTNPVPFEVWVRCLSLPVGKPSAGPGRWYLSTRPPFWICERQLKWWAKLAGRWSLMWWRSSSQRLWTQRKRRTRPGSAASFSWFSFHDIGAPLGFPLQSVTPFLMSCREK